MIENGTLPPATQVDALLEQRAQVHAQIIQGEGLLHQIDQAMKALGEYGYSVDGALHGVARNLDRLMWQRLLEVCQVHLFMEPSINSQWDIRPRTNRPFVRDQVDAALSELDERRTRMLAGGILMAAQKLFGGMRLGQQARVQGLFTYNAPWARGGYSTGGYFTINEHRMQHLDALHRLMCLADGAALPAADDLPSNWLIKPDYDQAPWQVYFTVDRYKNGNGRITLLRMDLADRLNACLDAWDLARAA